MWSDVLAFLETARFDDLLPGWIDRTGPFPVYRPFTFDACLQAESGLIQFTSVNNNGGLHIRMVDEIEYDEAFRDDPEVELLAASVGAHYLSASGSVRCTAMRLFTNYESVPDDGIFRAAEMTFEDTYTVFFDPFWTDGIRLGTGNTPDLWLAEHRSPRRQEVFGPLKETTWLPNPPVTDGLPERTIGQQATRARFEDPEHTRNASPASGESARSLRRSARKWRRDPWRTVNPSAPTRSRAADRGRRGSAVPLAPVIKGQQRSLTRTSTARSAPVSAKFHTLPKLIAHTAFEGE